MESLQNGIPVPFEIKELFLEAPALVSLAQAGQSDAEKEEAKQMALKLFHTETFAAPDELQEKLNQAEPYFKEVFDDLDASLPEDPEARKKSIKLHLKEILTREYSIDDAETTHWKHMLSKFAMYVTRSHKNIVESFFAPFTDIFLDDSDGIQLAELLNLK